MRALLTEFGKTAEREKIDVKRWTITNAVGTTQANYPWDPSVCNKNWSWRDWFNGQGDQHHAKDQLYPQSLRSIFPSRLWVSRRIGPKGWFCRPRFSIPRPRTPPSLLGVLAMTIDLKKVENWLKSVRLNDGFAILFDNRYHGLLHYRQDLVAARPDENPPVWPCRIYRIVIEDQESGHTLSYRDPVDQKVYLGDTLQCLGLAGA